MLIDLLFYNKEEKRIIKYWKDNFDIDYYKFMINNYGYSKYLRFWAYISSLIAGPFIINYFYDIY